MGAFDDSENQIIADLYRIALQAAGYTVTVRRYMASREVYIDQLRTGVVQVMPELASTLADFLNAQLNGASSGAASSGNIDVTMDKLRQLGGAAGLAVAEASHATDQYGFAVTNALADRYQLQTLSEFAEKCSGAKAVLAGPADCAASSYCQPGLQNKYGMPFGTLSQTDTSGPKTRTALRTGEASIGLLFTTDAAFG